MKQQKTLTYLVASLAIIAVMIVGNDLHAGTIVTTYADSFEATDGYPVDGSSIVGVNGWTVGSYCDNTATLPGSTNTNIFISDSDATFYGDKMLTVNTDNTGSRGGVYRSFTSTPITEGIVEFNISVKAVSGEYNDIVLGDSTIDVSNDNFLDGAAITCGLTTAGARSYAAEDRLDSGTLAAGWYTLHALLDMDAQKYCLQVLSEDGSTVVYDHDDWDVTGTAHTYKGYGTYESFTFKNNVTSIQNFGMRVLTATSVDFDNFSVVSTVVSEVPEPGTIALLFSGLIGLILWRRR